MWSLLGRRIKDGRSAVIMTVFIQKNICSLKFYHVIQATIWIFRRCFMKRLRKATHHFSTILGFQEMKIQFFFKKTCTRRFWNEQRQESSVLLTRVASGSELRPEVKPYFRLKNHLDFWKRRKIRLNVAKRWTKVSYVTTLFRPSSSPRSSTSKMDQKGSWRHNQKTEASPTKKSNTGSQHAEGNLRANHKTKRHWKRDRRRNLKHGWDSKRKQKQRNLRSLHLVYQKKQIRHNVLQMWLKAGRVNRLTRKESPHEDWKKVLKSLEPFVQLRIVEQTRRDNRHGSSPEQKYWAFMRDHNRRCTRKGSLTQKTDMERADLPRRLHRSLGKKVKHTDNQMVLSGHTKAELQSWDTKNARRTWWTCSGQPTTREGWKSSTLEDTLFQRSNTLSISWPWRLAKNVNKNRG